MDSHDSCDSAGGSEVVESTELCAASAQTVVGPELVYYATSDYKADESDRVRRFQGVVVLEVSLFTGLNYWTDLVMRLPLDKLAKL